jgi:hypothetical protein
MKFIADALSEEERNDEEAKVNAQDTEGQNRRSGEKGTIRLGPYWNTS